MKELPDIPGFSSDEEYRLDEQGDSHRARTQKSSGLSWGALIVTGLVSLVLASAISIGFVAIGKDQVMSWFGVAPAPAQADVNAVAIQKLQQELLGVTDELNALNPSELVRVSTTDELDAKLRALSGQVDTLRVNADNLKIDVAAQFTKLREASPKQMISTPVRAAPKPIANVVLVSVRNSAGIPMVALREGMNTSELLLPGDSWRGWTLIDAEPANRSATFTVAGKVRELRL